MLLKFYYGSYGEELITVVKTVAVAEIALGLVVLDIPVDDPREINVIKGITR